MYYILNLLTMLSDPISRYSIFTHDFINVYIHVRQFNLWGKLSVIFSFVVGLCFLVLVFDRNITTMICYFADLHVTQILYTSLTPLRIQQKNQTASPEPVTACATQKRRSNVVEGLVSSHANITIHIFY